MNATWRSNLLPRSRFLELTVFKKMLAQGLHLTRHDQGRAKPTTVFADREFRHLWWYKSVGTGVDRFAISSLLSVGTATDPKSGTTRQDVGDIVTISEDDYPQTLTLLFGGASKRGLAKKHKDASVRDAEGGGSSGGGGAEGGSSGGAGGGGGDEATEKQEVYFTCDSLDLYHLVLDGFGMILEHAEAAVVESTVGQHKLTLAHAQLGYWPRVLLAFQQLYRPEHHPNHPRRLLRNGQEVEVLYSSDYVVEFNGQLMRLPNPFFGPGMNCRGRIAAYDAETEFYTITYLDGPFEHDETPDPEKRDFPKGTVFEYVKRANLILDLSPNYRMSAPWMVVLLSALQLVGSLYTTRLGYSPVRYPHADGWMTMQLGAFEDRCPDLRGEVWRLWTYQSLPPGWVHLFYNLFVQLMLGIPVNCVHGNLVFLLLHQGLAIPLGALTAGYSDAPRTIGETVAGITAGTYAIIGVHLGNLLLNYSDSTHGLLRRELRLLMLVLVMVLEGLAHLIYPYQENVLSLHGSGLLLGFLFSVVVIRNLKMSHAERTYLIPAATWTLAAYIFFSGGWYAGVSPPTSLNRQLGNPTNEWQAGKWSPSCCWRLYACELRRTDADFFVCNNNRLEAQPWATAIVGGADYDPNNPEGVQRCPDYAQYLGLQYAAQNITIPSSTSAVQ